MMLKLKKHHVVLILIIAIMLLFARWHQPHRSSRPKPIAVQPSPVIDTSTGTLKFMTTPQPVMDSDNRGK